MIREHPVTSGIVIAVILVIAYFVDEFRLKMKPDQDFIRMTESSDTKQVGIALAQLHKRGKDISGFIHRVIPFLLSERTIDRVGAKLILKKHYPADFKLMANFDGIESIEKCREKLVSLHEKYGIHS